MKLMLRCGCLAVAALLIATSPGGGHRARPGAASKKGIRALERRGTEIFR
jgi:hypothetical protein